ncbi:hypothetical protein OV207_12355 [Corallococcus sp. BB11-1]|uniref:hypothetical protein n=1 Tax=Corallococcus sp. BB11-1 TaxID=2996783 RepID=UPI0010EF5BE3|nr:hypothetical protein [Corallococcus sp. BB11-1]MCY1032253.1 hypothetical protein [Corallococcus sp. BB11-1]RYZ13908.1 MAG: hypothetical protein EOO70_08160 [Myxococcaceae bacterium]
MEALTALKKHPKFPFTGYREDDEQYLMSQIYWLELIKSVTRQTQDVWVGWMAPPPDRDGSLIFSTFCPEFARGVIINQYAPTEDDTPPEQGGTYHPFVAWVDVLGDAEQGPVIEHLTINSEISAGCESHCLHLLKLYVVEKRSRQEMDVAIRELDEQLYGPVESSQ